MAFVTLLYVPFSTTKINSYDVRNRTAALAPRCLGPSVCPSHWKQEEAKGSNYVRPCPCYTLLCFTYRGVRGFIEPEHEMTKSKCAESGTLHGRDHSVRGTAVAARLNLVGWFGRLG
jgi:hypothetical protein